MGLLTKRYRETRKKGDTGEAKTAYAFKTGIDLLDWSNGKLVNVRGDESYYSVGIEEGTYCMFIGKSGTGKTSLALQIAARIVRDYENGAVYLDDVEAATSKTRFKALSGWTDEMIEDKFIHRNVGITAESFYKNIREVYNLKMELKDQITVTTDKLDEDGNPIEILEPTVYVLDSLAVLVPENVAEEDELSGSMSQTAVAKTNSMIFQRILPLLKKANIILFVINHVNQKIDINPMAKTKAQINYLKQDESIPGKQICPAL